MVPLACAPVSFHLFALTPSRHEPPGENLHHLIFLIRIICQIKEIHLITTSFYFTIEILRKHDKILYNSIELEIFFHQTLIEYYHKGQRVFPIIV